MFLSVSSVLFLFVPIMFLSVPVCSALLMLVPICSYLYPPVEIVPASSCLLLRGPFCSYQSVPTSSALFLPLSVCLCGSILYHNVRCVMTKFIALYSLTSVLSKNAPDQQKKDWRLKTIYKCSGANFCCFIGCLFQHQTSGSIKVPYKSSVCSFRGRPSGQHKASGERPGGDLLQPLLSIC